jgi:hypothetical protein
MVEDEWGGIEVSPAFYPIMTRDANDGRVPVASDLS